MCVYTFKTFTLWGWSLWNTAVTHISMLAVTWTSNCAFYRFWRKIKNSPKILPLCVQLTVFSCLVASLVKIAYLADTFALYNKTVRPRQQALSNMIQHKDLLYTLYANWGDSQSLKKYQKRSYNNFDLNKPFDDNMSVLAYPYTLHLNRPGN